MVPDCKNDGSEAPAEPPAAILPKEASKHVAMAKINFFIRTPQCRMMELQAILREKRLSSISA
jgi:hypothetical protein